MTIVPIGKVKIQVPEGKRPDNIVLAGPFATHYLPIGTLFPRTWKF